MKSWISFALWWWAAMARFDYENAYWEHCDLSDAFWARMGGRR